MTQSPLREQVAIAKMRRGITLQQVADEASVSYPYLRQYMCGMNESSRIRSALEQWVEANENH